VPQAPPDPVAHDGTTEVSADDKAHAGRDGLTLGTRAQVHDERGRAGAPPTANGATKRVARPEPVLGREH
jgi:hypothetical protein